MISSAQESGVPVEYAYTVRRSPSYTCSKSVAYLPRCRSSPFNGDMEASNLKPMVVSTTILIRARATVESRFVIVYTVRKRRLFPLASVDVIPARIAMNLVVVCLLQNQSSSRTWYCTDWTWTCTVIGRDIDNGTSQYSTVVEFLVFWHSQLGYRVLVAW